jgi:isopenicillin N synthase-like dioxygenase
MGATDSGLQLLDRDGSWLDVTTKPGQLVVDSGDMMARITNEVIPATTHRVINPDNSNSTRYSMPYFVHPNPEAMLSCIPSCVGAGEKYPPINSHEFLVQRLKEIGLLKTK